MPVERLKHYLDTNGVKYRSISHSKACTAQEIAAAAHVPGKKLAKSVVVKLNGELALAVMPAPDRLDIGQMKATAKTDNVEIATEDEFRTRFPGCELGSMPPFGNLYGMAVYVSQSLKGNHDIVFNAGSLTELIDLDYSDFERLVAPTVM